MRECGRVTKTTRIRWPLRACAALAGVGSRGPAENSACPSPNPVELKLFGQLIGPAHLTFHASGSDACATFPVQLRPAPACCLGEFYSVRTGSRLCAPDRSARLLFHDLVASVQDDQAPRGADEQNRAICRPRRPPTIPQIVHSGFYKEFLNFGSGTGRRSPHTPRSPQTWASRRSAPRIDEQWAVVLTHRSSAEQPIHLSRPAHRRFA
jgi:hypothetical protein